MSGIAELRERITDGWTVDITDHMHSSESRDGAKVESVTAHGMTIRPRRPWGSQGMRFPVKHFMWDEDKDVEVDGTTVRFYRTPTSTTSRSTAGVRELAVTYTFHPPYGR